MPERPVVRSARDLLLVAGAFAAAFWILMPLAFFTGFRPPRDSALDVGLAVLVWGYLAATPLLVFGAWRLGAGRGAWSRFLVVMLVLWLLAGLGLGLVGL